MKAITSVAASKSHAKQEHHVQLQETYTIIDIFLRSTTLHPVIFNIDHLFTLAAMEHRLLLNPTLLVLLLMMTVPVTQGTVVKSKYRKIEQGQNITGTIRSEIKTRSKLECSDR